MVALTQDRIRNLLDYDANTGVFTWRSDESRSAQWNRRYAGRVAGCKATVGYLVIRINNVLYYAHRLAWLHSHGSMPKQIDHKDCDRLNNCIANLREATTRQNNWNLSKSAANTSGFKGVSYHKQTGKWRARIKASGKYVSLGLFSSRQGAHAAYAAAANSHRGDFARVA